MQLSFIYLIEFDTLWISDNFVYKDSVCELFSRYYYRVIVYIKFVILKFADFYGLFLMI